MRVVLDTNTLITALVFHREWWTWMREAWKSGRIVPLLCSETATELIRVLAYPKFRLSSDEQTALIHDIVPYCDTVSRIAVYDLGPCRDSQDQIFLRLAKTGSAIFLVSGDNALLSYTGPVPLRIVRPADLMDALAKDEV